MKSSLPLLLAASLPANRAGAESLTGTNNNFVPAASTGCI